MRRPPRASDHRRQHRAEPDGHHFRNRHLVNDGGYTIKVPVARYRLEVELRGGDQLAKQPEQTNVNIGDVDERMDFVIGR